MAFKLSKKQFRKVKPLFDAAVAHRASISRLSKEAFAEERKAWEMIGKMFPEINLNDKTYRFDVKNRSIA